MEFNNSILWIGGSPDSGKSTIARYIVQKYNLSYYDYDGNEDRHHEEISAHSVGVEEILSSTMEDNWVYITPDELLHRANASFRGRFPMVVRDLSAMNADNPILAEGFGLTPQLVAPFLGNSNQAIWLVSDGHFKMTSAKKRRKLSGEFKTSDMENAALENLHKRDMLIDAQIREEANQLGLEVIEVKSSVPFEVAVKLVEKHFDEYLTCWRRHS
ncbi:hypothetical protein EJP82_23665 [Paenibacillus anaericanus]|uniref:Adenylyl-sulfate kinase n=1 Tax=Paenibacillus anaericanus TaxID=170367 RepID=A0A3S1BHX5_9BACL|nr:hypothetical protein [Paenibacillus anaericanus]RUT41365.1 hypothetical protein EJP82_23665 [Paenibacillus anaericanus]